MLILPSFLQQAELLSKDVKSKLIKCLRLLSVDFRHPGLQTKKVQGSVGVLFECRVDQSIRLIYDLHENALRCWYVGEHDKSLRFASNNEIAVDDIELIEHEKTNEPYIAYLQDGLLPSFVEMILNEFIMAI